MYWLCNLKLVEDVWLVPLVHARRAHLLQIAVVLLRASLLVATHGVAAQVGEACIEVALYLLGPFGIRL